MTKPARIVIVGSCNVDLTTFTSRFPNPGETMFGNRFDLGFGGKGANQAVAAKRCGADVSMVARVGGDLFGEATVKNFASLGIDATHVGFYYQDAQFGTSASRARAPGPQVPLRTRCSGS